MLSLPVGKTDKGEDIPGLLVSRRLPDHLGLHESTFYLGNWIAKCLDSQKALDWVISQGGVLHAALRRGVQHQLDSDDQLDDDDENKVCPALRKIWKALPVGSADSTPLALLLGEETIDQLRQFLWLVVTDIVDSVGNPLHANRIQFLRCRVNHFPAHLGKV